MTQCLVCRRAIIVGTVNADHVCTDCAGNADYRGPAAPAWAGRAGCIATVWADLYDGTADPADQAHADFRERWACRQYDSATGRAALD